VSGNEDYFVVPSGVTSLSIEASGGWGGSTPEGLLGASGGAGATVTATVMVTSGTQLYVEVGGDGTVDGTIKSAFNGGGQVGCFVLELRSFLVADHRSLRLALFTPTDKQSEAALRSASTADPHLRG
jgi:hypothetical protein